MKTPFQASLKIVVCSLLRVLRGLFLALLALAPSAWAGTVLNYTTAGNHFWICPPGITQIQIECYGGGGGGGGTVAAACAAGGGAGGTYVQYSVSVTPGTVYNLTVGAGGLLGPSGGASSGGNGGDSYFGNATAGNSDGASVLAPGGNGGNGAVTGYSAAGGDAKITGAVAPSGATVIYAAKGGDAAASPASSGAGSAGAGPLGGSGGGARTNENNGLNGSSPGGGGGGAFSVTVTKSGGSGAAGRITLMYSVPPGYYTSAGIYTWVAPFSGTVQVECWGGGGGGGGAHWTSSANGHGGGGGGGAYAKLNSYSVTAGNSYAVVVGSGGGGSTGADGSDGGDSYFVNPTTVFAQHGSKGVLGSGGNGSGGSGGAADFCYGDVKKSGGGGSNGTGSAGGGGGGSGGVASDGNPAASSTGAVPVTGGGNGGDGYAAATGNGNAPNTFPGGGGGGGKAGNTTDRAGGSGAAGQVVIAYSTLIGNDYRSAGTGNWGTAGNWQVSADGGATWATASSKPGAADNVYIQSGHTITLGGNESCCDLHIAKGNASGDTARGTVALGANTLSVHGRMRCYYAAVGATPGTSHPTGYGVYPFTASGGKVSIAGYSRALTLATEWSGTISSPGSGVLPMSIDLAAGQTATLATSFKASSWVLNSGTLDCGVFRLAVDNNVAAQGDVTISSGAVLRSAASGISGGSQVMSRINGGRAGTLTIAAGGKLQLSGATPCVDMNAVALNGAIEYTAAGAQTLLKPSGQDGSAAVIATYQDLILNGNGVKNLSANATVNGVLTMAGDATGVSLGLGIFTLTYGASSTLAYAGAAPQITNPSELPAATLHNLSIANTSGVSLNQGVTVNGVLTVDSGCNLNFNSQTITTASAPVLNGSLTMPVTRTGANTFSGSRLTQTAGTLTYGGTLTASLLSGGPILAGEAIPLFVSSGGFGGGFTSVTAPSQSGLAADTSPLIGGSGGSIAYQFSGFGQFASYYGLTGGMNGDDDHDGATNLAEFAFDTLPNNSSSGNSAMVYGAGTISAHGTPTLNLVKSPASVDFSAVFCRRKNYVSAGLTYTVQFSADLSFWSSSTAAPTVVASDATVDAVSVPYPLFISSPGGDRKPQYFRVQVTSAP